MNSDSLNQGVRPGSTMNSNAEASAISNPAPALGGQEGSQEKESLDALAKSLDSYSLEQVVESKLARFLEQIGDFYPENFHSMIMQKVEKPLVSLILQRTGGNQVHAANILGINRNTLRKKIKMYNL